MLKANVIIAILTGLSSVGIFKWIRSKVLAARLDRQKLREENEELKMKFDELSKKCDETKVALERELFKAKAEIAKMKRDILISIKNLKGNDVIAAILKDNT